MKLLLILLFLVLFQPIFGYDLVYDKQGIPSVDYGKIKGINIGVQKNPVTISLKATEYLEFYEKTGNQTMKEKFFNNIEWLVNNAISKNNYSIYEYQYPWPAL